MSLSSASSDPIAIFFSNASEDEDLCKKLEQHLILLKRQKFITFWRPAHLAPGSVIQDEIDKQLQAAQIILLLISSSFMASDECYHETQIALERHKSGHAYSIPILLRPVGTWQDSPLSELSALPDNGKPVTLWSERDLAFSNVADGIRKVIEKIRMRRALVPSEHRLHQRMIEYPPPPHPKATQLRENIVKEIYDKLIAQDTTAVVLTGIIGAGKSILANLLYHYAERQRRTDSGPFTAEALKLRIDPTVTLAELIETVSEVVGEPLYDIASIPPPDLAWLFFRRLNHVSSPRLIIIDQFENLLTYENDGELASDIKEWLHLLHTHTCNCSIVLVSRIRIASVYDDFAPHIYEYHTNGLEIEEGVELLRNWDIGIPSSELQSIVKHFSGHALALTLFASLSHSSEQLMGLFDKNKVSLTPMEEITRCIEEIYVHQLNALERKLLFAFAIYREPMPLDAALALLDENVIPFSKNVRLALESLSAHCLLQGNNNYYQPHTLVTNYVYSKSRMRYDQQDDRKVLFIAHEKAAAYYQQRIAVRSHRQLSDDINSIHDLIEIAWHFCQAQQWQRAYMIMDQENIVTYLLRVGRSPMLLELYQQLLPFHKWRAQPQQAARVLKDLGKIYDRLGRKNEAQQHFEQALTLFRETGERQQEASTLIHLGEIYNALEAREKAFTCYEQALSICNQEGIAGEKNKAIVLNNLGKLSYEQSQKEQSLEYYTQALLFHSDVSEEATTLNNLAGLYEDLGKTVEAYRYYQKSLRFFQEVGDRRGEGSSLHNLGRYQRKQGKTKEAQEYYECAWRIFHEIGDRWSESVTLRNLSQLHIVQGNYPSALACIFLAKKILQELQNARQNDMKGILVLLSHQLGKEQFETMWAHFETNEQNISPFVV
jgi:tetratricopeptide (TPR) repeat protein